MNTSFSQVLPVLFLTAPQFYTIDPTIIAGYEALYTVLLTQVNQQFLSCNATLAMALLLAYYLTVSFNPNSGVFNNIKEGDLNLGYNVAHDMNAMNLNPYGRMYIDLIKRTTVGTTVTNLPVQFGGIIQNMPVQCGCGSGQTWTGAFLGGTGGCC